MDYNLIIDIENRRLVAGFDSTEAGAPPSPVFGDQPTVNVQLVEPNHNDADNPWRAVTLTGQSIRVGVGSLADATPSAYIELTDDLASASATITEIRAGVLNTTNEIQRVQILDALAGNYTLTIAGETTNSIALDASLETIVCELEGLASITADSVSITGSSTDYNVEFASSLADVGAITANLDNITSRVGKTGTLDLHVDEILTLLDGETSVEATLEVVRWTTADVAGETVLQTAVTVSQDVIPDTVPGTTPLPGYATIDLDHINQSGAATGQIPTWNGSEWVPSTVSGTGDLLSTANLSDLADIPTARTNLGLGTAATTASTDYATSAQGTLADSALQSADIDTLAELNAIVTDATLIDTADSRLSDARTPTAHTHTASDIDAEASTDGYVLTSDGAGNAAWEASTGGSGHDPVTVTDSAEIDFTLTGQDITASLIASSIDETKLDASTNASLNLADSASQPGHTHTASDVTDFDTEVSNNTDVAANTADRHDAASIAASGGRDYVTISGTQQLTLHPVDLTADVSGDLPVADGGTGASDAATARTNLGVDAAGTDNSTDVTIAGEDYLSLAGQAITANAIDLDNLSATGTPSSSTYLRGDNTWATVSGGGGGASVSVSDTAPTSPSAGDLWFDSTTAKMYVYYNDGNSNQWVSVTSGLPTPDSKTGWMDYNDSTGSFSVAADTWTNVPNNGAGSFTNKTYKPPSVTEVVDTTTGHLDFSDLPLGSELTLRNDITVVPNSNNALLQMRYVLGTGANEYALNFLNDRLDSGSGVSYQKVNTFPIYMGDTNTKNNAGKLQIKLSVAGTVTNSGVYASIQLY